MQVSNSVLLFPATPSPHGMTEQCPSHAPGAVLRSQGLPSTTVGASLSNCRAPQAAAIKTTVVKCLVEGFSSSKIIFYKHCFKTKPKSTLLEGRRSRRRVPVRGGGCGSGVSLSAGHSIGPWTGQLVLPRASYGGGEIWTEKDGEAQLEGRD